jgi:hypothetical protein
LLGVTPVVFELNRPLGTAKATEATEQKYENMCPSDCDHPGVSDILSELALQLVRGRGQTSQAVP